METRFLTSQPGQPTRAVIKYNIIGTQLWILRAVEKTANPYDLSNPCPHSSVMNISGDYYGDISSRRITKAIENLKPGSLERIEKVHAWYEGLNAESYELILRAYPELMNLPPESVRRTMGQIEVIAAAQTTQVEESYANC